MKRQRREVTDKFTPRGIHIAPLTKRQGEYLDALNSQQQVIVTGCAGTGKTYIAMAHAAKQYQSGAISKIVLTRPNVGAGQSLGFFAGTLEEKIAPWVVPFTEVLKTLLGVAVYEIALKKGNIEVVPFEVMRGRTFDNAIVVLDEGQNTTPQEMKMFLTRIGKYSQVIVNGDIQQSDIPTASGLATILGMTKKYRLPVGVVEFTVDDIVRSDICAQWVRAFHNEKI